MSKIVEGWKGIIANALLRAEIVSAKFTGKIIISVADGGIKFVEICQTVK